MMKQLSKTKDKRGQSMVETALILPIILLILLGIFEFSRVLNAWMVITHASREGARMASLGGSVLEIEQRIDAVSDTLNLENITVSVSPSGSLDRGDMVTVTVTYDIAMITPLVGAIVGNTLTMDSETVMRVE